MLSTSVCVGRELLLRGPVLLQASLQRRDLAERHAQDVSWLACVGLAVRRQLHKADMCIAVVRDGLLSNRAYLVVCAVWRDRELHS